MASDDQHDLEKYPEARGEDEKERPQPADEVRRSVDGGPERSAEHDATDHRQDGKRWHDSWRLEDPQSHTARVALRFQSLSALPPPSQSYGFRICSNRSNTSGLPASCCAGPRHGGHGWMVITGAGGGIMEAGHLGAGRDLSMGLNILLPFEQSANPIIDGDPKLVTLKYFFTRKLMFVKECSAVICLPGGFGTLDETLEVLTLLQTGKQTMIPMVLLDEPGGTYWEHFGKFVEANLLKTALISPEDLALLHDHG